MDRMSEIEREIKNLERKMPNIMGEDAIILKDKINELKKEYHSLEKKSIVPVFDVEVVGQKANDPKRLSNMTGGMNFTNIF